MRLCMLMPILSLFKHFQQAVLVVKPFKAFQAIPTESQFKLLLQVLVLRRINATCAFVFQPLAGVPAAALVHSHGLACSVAPVRGAS